jgi:hypothetical protein
MRCCPTASWVTAKAEHATLGVGGPVFGSGPLEFPPQPNPSSKNAKGATRNWEVLIDAGI